MDTMTEPEVDLMEFGATQVSSIMTAITNVIDVAGIIEILAAAIGVAAVFVFMWWGIRKGARMIMGAIRKGRLGV